MKEMGVRIEGSLRLGAGICLALSLSAGTLMGQLGSRPSGPKLKSSKNVSTLLHDGIRLAEEKRFVEAQIPLKKALGDDPTNFSVLFTLGKVDARLGELAPGIQLLRKSAEIEPKNAEVHLDLALTLAGAGKLPEALAQISIAEKLQPKSEPTHLHRGRMLAQLNRPAEPALEFSAAKSLAPRDPSVYFYWALLERNQGNLRKETALLRVLTRLAPHSSIAFYLLGKSLSSQGKVDAAIGALKRAVTLNPSESEAIYLLAMDTRQRDPQAAKELMRRFQKVREQQAGLSHIKALGDMAVHDSAKGDWAEAIKLFRKALRECDGCSLEPSLRKDLGLTLCRNGQIAEGMKELKEALKLDPNDPQIVKALRIIEEKTGSKE